MVDATTINAVSASVASDTSHVALGYLGHQSLNRAARMGEIERLHLAVPVVEVQANIARPAVATTTLGSNLVQDRSVSLDVAITPLGVRLPPSRILPRLRITSPRTRLMAFPGLRRVVALTTGHMGILPVDSYGDEALNHVELTA